MKKAFVILLSLLLSVSVGCAAKAEPEAAVLLPDRQTATYAVLVGTISEKYVDEHFPDAEKLPFDSINDAVLALISGKADYVVSAYTNCLNFVRANPGKLAVLPDVLTSEGCAVAVNKSETALLNDINRVLEGLIEDGTVERVISNWIREDGSDYIRDEIPLRADGPVLCVAVSAEREPMCFVEDGEIVGLDAELIQRIAYELGMRVEFSDMKFSAMIPSVLSGKTPVAVSNVTATAERRESVAFSTEYFLNPQTIMTRTEFLADAPAEGGFTKLSDLAGKRIGVSTGSVYDAAASAQWPDAELMYFETMTDEIIALQQGKIDAFVSDEPMARIVLQTTPKVQILDEPLLDDKYGFAFQKNDSGNKLRDEFNTYMHTAESGSLLEQLDGIWFGTDDTLMHVDAAHTLPATNGTIRFAATMESEPFSYLKDDQPVGFEIDLLTRFCRDMGYGLEIDTASFGALLPGLVTDRYDIVASCISITEERAQSVGFSDPFYYGGMVVITASGDSENTVPVEDSRMGALTGTTCEALAQSHYPNAKYSSFTGIGDMMVALKTGKLDYCIMAEIDAINYKRADQGYTIQPDVLGEGKYSIAVAKDSGDLVEKLSLLLEKYEADGTLKRLKENWIRPDGSAYVVDEVEEREDGPVLRVALCSGLEPSCFIQNGELAGYDVELIKRLAFELGYRTEFFDMQFSALVAALESGRADVAISGIAATAERAEKVDFTGSYYKDPLILVRYESDDTEDEGFVASIKDSFRKNFLVESRWKLLASGIGITLLISVCAGIVGIVFGFLFCLMRMNRLRALNSTASILTRILQGTPIVVLLMILYYIVFNKTGLDGISVAVIAFALNFGAYASEIMLSGINAVDRGQLEAAYAIGFTPSRTFLKIVFPQAARHFLPVLKGEYISLVKMTSIVGYVAVQDLTKVSDIIRSRTYEAFFPLIVTAIIYFLLSYGLSSLLKLIEIRIDPKRRPRTLKGVNLK